MGLPQAQNAPSAIASGTINAHRFVKFTSTDHTLAQADANAVIAGVGPDYSVSTGEAFPYQMIGPVWIQLGSGGGTAGNEVKSDANGKAVELSGGGTGSENENVGGILLESGSADDVVRMQVARYESDTS